MLSVTKLREFCRQKQVSVEQVAGQLIRPGLDKKAAMAAVKNWKNGLFKPRPRREDIRRIATALAVNANDVADWCSSYRYAPISPRKAQLVTQLVVGRPVQDALDILKFTRKRAASMVDKILRSAVADADEQQADVDNLYVSQARVDDAGVRVGTKRWIPKDRGKAYPIRQRACHIHITVTQI
jgi:large subunit ribosomal protein L22